MVSPSGMSKYLNKAVEVHMKERLEICENKRFKRTFSCVWQLTGNATIVINDNGNGNGNKTSCYSMKGHLAQIILVRSLQVPVGNQQVPGRIGST